MKPELLLLPRGSPDVSHGAITSRGTDGVLVFGRVVRGDACERYVSIS